jgi:hypothetical protein
MAQQMIALIEYCKSRGFDPRQVKRFIDKGKFNKDSWVLLDGTIMIIEQNMDEETKKFRPKGPDRPPAGHWLGRRYRRK